MIIVIFLITLFIQLLTLVVTFKKKESALQSFALFSIPINLLIILIFNFKIHHLLKNELGIPNTFFYIICFIVCLTFFLYFRKIIFKYSYWLIISAFVLWSLSGLLDLISDGKLLKIKLPVFYEDSAMFLGSAFWLAFYSQILYQLLIVSKPEALQK